MGNPIEQSNTSNNSLVKRVIEELRTLKDIAASLGLPVFKVTRAAKAGHFPTYTLFNSRKLARLSEVVAVIDASRNGGSNDRR